MYLANDVIQNSKKKGNELSKSFASILSKAFRDISKNCTDEKTFSSLNRILKIWDERGVYESEKIKQYEADLKSGNPVIIKAISSESKSKDDSSRKRKAESTSSQATNGSEAKKFAKSISPTNSNGDSTHVTILNQSSTQPDQEAPEPEDLIKMMESLEEAASSDAATREKITKLPPEVSSLEALNKLEDKEAAAKLQVKVNEAVNLLSLYNHRLTEEMNERNKLAVMLNAFHKEQEELLKQSEQRLQVITIKKK
jgi:regulator of Ty1 transposition protein 103